MFHSFRSANRSTKISEKITEHIRKAIFDGRLKPGDKLPIERELIRQFGASKATIREALRSLEVLGFVRITKGVSGGAFVTEVDVKKVRNYFANFLLFKHLSVKNLTEVRLLLEPFVAEKVARIIKKDQLEQLGKMVEEFNSVLEKDNSHWGDIDFHQFHQILAELSGNPILSFVVDFIENLMLDIRNSLGGGKSFSRKVQRSDPHRRIYDALVKGDPRKARAEMRKHVLQVDRNLLALKSRKRSRVVQRGKNRVQTALAHGTFLVPT